jgi:hypothetical protein
VRTFETVEQLRLALLDFRQTYNTTWLIQRHGFIPSPMDQNGCAHSRSPIDMIFQG